MNGIYKYTDLETEDIVYIGKDSNIDKNTRHKAHLSPSKYDDQPFNSVLQNNPDRYEYSVLWSVNECSTLKLNKMEILFGKIFNPKFNFDKFGKGGCIGHSEESRQKISENNAKYWKDKTRSDGTKQKISEANKGKTLSDEHKMNVSKSRNTTGYLNVYKDKDNRYKQGFRWKYQYYDENGKHKSITSISLKKLEAKVKAEGLLWRET